jgi:hypothetical protein
VRSCPKTYEQTHYTSSRNIGKGIKSIFIEMTCERIKEKEGFELT